MFSFKFGETFKNIIFHRTPPVAASEYTTDALSVCHFKSMKNPVEMNSLFYYITCSFYIAWLHAALDDLQTRPLRQILLFLGNDSLAVLKLKS